MKPGVTSVVAPLVALVQILLIAGIAGVFNKVFNRVTTFDDAKLLYGEGHVSYNLQRYGFYLVPVIGGMGVVGNFTQWSSLQVVAINTVIACIVALFVSYLADLVILLRRPTSINRMPDVPLAAAITKLGFYVVAALALFGIIGGGTDDAQAGLTSNAILLALSLIVAAPLGYFLLSAFSPAKLRLAVQNGSIEAGIVSAGYLALIGEMLLAATRGYTTSVNASITRFVVAMGVGVICAVVASRTIDRFVLVPDDDNPDTDRTLKTIIEDKQLWPSVTLAFLMAAVIGPLLAYVLHLLLDGYLVTG